MVARAWPIRLAFWLVICSISAAPSFYVGTEIVGGEPLQLAGMGLGILAWVGIYTWASGTGRARRMHRRPRVRRTLRIGYATRVALSVIVPVGLFLDIWCGLASVWIGRLFVGDEETFSFALITTVVQGGVLNVVLAIYMGIVLAAQRLIGGADTWSPDGCRGCGYSLVGITSERCPECGLPVHEDPDAPAPAPAKDLVGAGEAAAVDEEAGRADHLPRAAGGSGSVMPEPDAAMRSVSEHER